MLVSIVIPCFNVEDYIEECIVSVMGQTYKEKEIICIDNNSSDGTWDKLIELKEKYPEITIEKELKAGAPAARNKGLSLVKGEWIQFLDADDLLLPQKIENQIALVKKNSNLSFIVGACIRRDINLTEREIEVFPGNPFLRLLKTELGNTCSNLFNLFYIKKIGGWNENYTSSQEAYLMFELLKINDNIIYDKELNTVIRERENGQISQSNPVKKWSIYVELRIEIIKYLQEYYPQFYENKKSEILNIFFGILRIFAEYNRAKSVEYFHKFFPKNFKPVTSNLISRKYIILYVFYGFERTEAIISFLKKRIRN